MKTIIYLFLFAFSFSFSQDYIPLDTTDYKKRALLIDKINKDYESLEKSFKKKYKSKMRKEITSSYYDLFSTLKKDVEKKKLVFNPEFVTYINNITTTILKKNTTLITDDIKVYLTKHSSPNALSMGSGYILLNMGLFKYLKNEAQLVSVLSHEIAHQVLNHSEKSILTSANSETSNEKIKEANRIKKKKYSKQSEAFSVFKDILYENKKKHRKQEIEADSIGFLLYNNTKYPPKDFLGALSVLAEIDTLPSIEIKKDTYKAFFNLPKQPFKEEWMKVENFDGYNYNHFKNKINKDSLKSHPEIMDRIGLLKKSFAKQLEVKKETVDNTEFKKLQKIARYEDVANLSYIKKYGLSIYMTLYKLQKDPKNEFYKKWLGVNFSKLYDAKKQYQLNKYIDRLVPNKQEESYQQFLSFLWNLRLNEIEGIANHYNK